MGIMSIPSVEQAIETFNSATEENQLSALRQMQVIHLPAEGEVWMTGDMHDHRRNFDKLLRAVDLENNPQRHLVLHELIHGDHFDASGAEDSWQTLYRAAELKCDFPGQVHFLLANHDLAQVHGEGIMKSGMSVCEAFTAALKRDFGSVYQRVNAALIEFLMSLPLAIRSPNGLFFCHSLPTDSQLPTFDYTIFDRPLNGQDYKRRTGPVYQLIWGRGVTPAGVEQFLTHLNAQLLMTGHQPQDTGFAVNGDRHLIIASDHNQGVFLPLDLAEHYTMDDLVGRIRKFVSLDV
jgi:Calcineurin-like phosphoesterase